MLIEQIGDGSSYSELKPVKSIVVADFDFVPKSEKCHTVFQMLEKDEHFPFSDLEEIHVLSLKKLSKLNDESLLGWLKFINSESEEEFMQLAKSNPVFEKAVGVLSMMSADKSNRMLYEARLKEWRDNKSRIDGAWTEGVAIGEARGKVEGKAEGKLEGMQELLSLLEQGVPLAEAKKKLGLE
jgi:predicted transposase/invertase (TIGR01784 family)